MPKWVQVSIAASCNLFIAMAIGRFSYTLMLPALKNEAVLSAADAEIVGPFNLAGWIVGAAIALFQRSWADLVVLHACLFVSIVSLFACIPAWGVEWLAFWRFLLGVTAAMIMIYSVGIVGRAAPSARLGIATGIVFAGVGTGIVLSAWLVPLLLSRGVAAAWIGLASVCTIACAVGVWFWRAAERRLPLPPPSFAGLWQLPRPAWMLVLAQTLFSVGLIPHTLYLVDFAAIGLGSGMNFGATLWVWFGVGGAVGAPLWGAIVDHRSVGYGIGLVAVFATLAASIALTSYAPSDWALCAATFFVGTQTGFSAIIVGRAQQIFDSGAHTVWALMTFISGAVVFFGGFGVYALFRSTESYATIFLLGAAAMAVGAVIALGLRQTPASRIASPAGDIQA
jgi:predicted MFS family arabinose efflux permease